jgi:hypothetical protein
VRKKGCRVSRVHIHLYPQRAPLTPLEYRESLIRASTSFRDASFGSTALRPSLQASHLACVFLRLLLTLHSDEEMLQFLEGFLGAFFLKEMAAIETVPGNR